MSPIDISTVHLAYLASGIVDPEARCLEWSPDATAFGACCQPRGPNLRAMSKKDFRTRIPKPPVLAAIFGLDP